MELILNGDPRAIDASECANLAELVSTVERLDASEEDCVVVSIEIDGEALSPDALAALELHSLEGVRQIDIERRPALLVARSVLAQAADYTGQITSAIARTVTYYRDGRSDLANDLLAHVTDSMSVLTGITYSVSNVLIEESKVLADLQGEIFPWLEELVEAQTQQDPIRIADTLEYEVSPRIAEWGATLRSLKNGVPAANEAASGGISN